MSANPLEGSKNIETVATLAQQEAVSLPETKVIPLNEEDSEVKTAQVAKIKEEFETAIASSDHDTQVKDQQGAVFSVPEKTAHKTGLLKKIGLIAAASLVGFLPAKAKGGDDKKNSGKQQYKTEVSAQNKKESSENTLEIFELTDQNKTDWNELIDSVKAKGLSGSKFLNSKKNSDKFINDFIKAKQAKGDTTTVSLSMVGSVQKYLLDYKDTLNAREADLELHHGKTLAAWVDRAELKKKFDHHEPITPVTFMDSLKTEVDWRFGKYTSQFKFPKAKTIRTVVNPVIKGSVQGIAINTPVEGGKNIVTNKDEGFETIEMINKAAEDNKKQQGYNK